MNARELILDLRALGPGQDTPEALLYTRLLCRYLADHLHEATLQSGMGLRDLSDVIAWLRELADVARNPETPIRQGVALALQRNAADRGRSQPARWDDTCPRCGHVHEGLGQCGMPMGGGGICGCELEVA
jgi:hypothetical protein